MDTRNYFRNDALKAEIPDGRWTPPLVVKAN
jgi:hypothetical protein